MFAPSPQATPADFVKKWTLRFADNNFQIIREATFREFAADVAQVFGVSVASVPEYQPGITYQKGFLVRYTPAGSQEAFYYALNAGVLAAPGPGNLMDWKVVPGPVAATALSQFISLMQAQGIEGAGVVAGRRYAIDMGLNANGKQQYLYLDGLDQYFDTSRGTLEVEGTRTAVEAIDLNAGTWTVTGATTPQGGPQITAQLLGFDAATNEFLVLLSPSAPTTVASYVLAEYTAGTTPTTPTPGAGNNYVAAGYVTAGYVN
jgi:hypothetical protein